jgi:hypothetical protein
MSANQLKLKQIKVLSLLSSFKILLSPEKRLTFCVIAPQNIKSQPNTKEMEGIFQKNKGFHLIYLE